MNHAVLCSRNDSFKDINYQVKKQINHDYITVNKIIFSLKKVIYEKINDLVKNVYFNGYNKENPFITTKCDK